MPGQTVGTMDEHVARSKKNKLVEHLRELDSLLVAFSGGVDSTFLLSVAQQILGKNVLAVTASSLVHPVQETENAQNFTRRQGIRHTIIHTDELNRPEFVSNTAERCYHCKRYLLEILCQIASKEGIKHVAHGANIDDLNDFRPGFRAAGELGVVAPLIDVRLGKEEIRFLSKEMGLGTWDNPAMACLASRIPYGDLITQKNLTMVAEAEKFLAQSGFKQFRVRCHGTLARIEVHPPDLRKITEELMREKLVEKFRQIGFLHVSVDLEGYKTGSLNRALTEVVKRGKYK
jgi:uncharacterized protein